MRVEVRGKKVEGESAVVSRVFEKKTDTTDRRQVLVTVELKLTLFHRVANPNCAVTRIRK